MTGVRCLKIASTHRDPGTVSLTTLSEPMRSGVLRVIISIELSIAKRDLSKIAPQNMACVGHACMTALLASSISFTISLG